MRHIPIKKKPLKLQSPRSHPRTPRSIPQNREKQIWDAFFSRGAELNLAPTPKLRKTAVHGPYQGISTVARVWAGARVKGWEHLNLGNTLASDMFSKWLRTNKNPKYHRPHFEAYEEALRREFRASPGIGHHAIVFRGMPRLPTTGIHDKSPMSSTRHLPTAKTYGMNDPNMHRHDHEIVAILLRPGTKVLPVGGYEAEYLLPPGTVKPVGPPRTISRHGPDEYHENLEYINNMVNYFSSSKSMLTKLGLKKQVRRPYRPGNHRTDSYVVTPAVFIPDPRWS
mgnify:CR=1 FL=1